MKPGQEAIYYLAGDRRRGAARARPSSRASAPAGLEVLLLADPIDAFWPDRLDAFEGKPLRSVTQGAADLSKLDAGAPSRAAAGRRRPGRGAEGRRWATRSSDVRATDRLVDSAVVLAAGAGRPRPADAAPAAPRRARTMPRAPPVLEINPRHALIRDARGRRRRRGADRRDRPAPCSTSPACRRATCRATRPPSPGA